MSVRKRKWTTRSGEAKEAWVADYADAQGKRHIHTFARKKDADSPSWTRSASTFARASTHQRRNPARSRRRRTSQYPHRARRPRTGHPRKLSPAHRPAHQPQARPRATRQAGEAPRINKFRNNVFADNLSRLLAKKVLTSLKSILRDAQRRGNVAQNVARDVSIGLDKRDQRKLKIGVDIPTREEVKIILDTASGRLRPLLVTAVFAGLRASELRGLRSEFRRPQGRRGAHPLARQPNCQTRWAGRSRIRASAPCRSARW